MKLRFYTEDGVLAGHVPDVAAFEQIREEFGAGFVLDPDDLAMALRDERVAGVRAEAQRRMMELLGARDAAHLDVLISNGTREAVRLLRAKADGATWTEAEARRARELELIDKAIDEIREASNVLEDMDPVPEDYRDDEWWP